MYQVASDANTRRPPESQVYGEPGTSSTSKQTIPFLATGTQPQPVSQQSARDPQSLYLFPTSSATAQAPVDFTDIDLPDFPLSHEDWTGILDGADLGLGVENAREMSAYFEQYFAGTDVGANGQADGNNNNHQTAEPGRLPLIPGQRGLF
jgi:hypothetical protein